MSFTCIGCGWLLQPSFKACPNCGEAITPFLRQHQNRLIGGNYRLTGFLARGGMGEVYLAEHVHLGAPCVIKVMRGGTDNPALAERFLREARLARKIHSPNVALLYDFSVLADGTQYMVWEYIEGPTIARLIAEEGALAPRRAIALAIQALRGLEAVHRAGVVHRDISPDNILVAQSDEGPVAKVIDLGIAKSGVDAGDSQTATGVFIGKLRYASPEQLGALDDDERIDGRSDLYSLALVLYEMLAGGPAVRATSAQRYIAMQLHEPLPPLSLARIDDVLAKATAKNRDLRFESARAFADALTGVLADVEDVRPRTTQEASRSIRPTTTPETPYVQPATRPPLPRRRRSALVAALPLLAAALMLVITGATWWMWRQRSHSPTAPRSSVVAKKSVLRSTSTPPKIAAMTSSQPPATATADEPLLSQPVQSTMAPSPKPAVEMPRKPAAETLSTDPEPSPPPPVTASEPAVAQAPEPVPAPSPALKAAQTTADYQREGTYKNWRGRIAQVEVLVPFAFEQYQTISVLPVDVSDVNQAADIDHVRLMRDARALLTENLRKSVGGRTVVLSDDMPSAKGTLVLRYRLRKYRGNFTPGTPIPTRSGFMTRSDATGSSVVDGEVLDAATGTVLVRFWQEREGLPSVADLLYPRPVNLIRNSLRAIGGDAGFLLSSF